MTAFAISNGSTTEWDALTGGSVNATLDTYTISNGSTLRIACDSYQCLNHSVAFGSLDTVSYSGTGGKLQIDGRDVRIIPFNSGTGNVPAIGTSIVQGSVSGPLLGVWANWQSEPVSSGTAMPTTGFIKIKSKTGGSFTTGALTNIGASSTGPDVVGWIEIRGSDTATITVPRIGTFETIGDWFELGTTNGTRGQILQCPTTATVAGVFPGVWIETASGSGVYERFAGAGSIVALASIPTDERGKIFWQTTGGIRLGSDGTNNVGYLPPTGCKVRIPNIILTCNTRTVSGSGPRVLPNATLATRQEFITTSAGDINISNSIFQWYGNFVQAFRVKIRDSAFNNTLVQSEISSPIDISNIIVSPTQAQINLALNMSSCFGGGSFSDSLLARFSLATSGSYVNSVTYSKGITFSNIKTQTITNRANGTVGTWIATQMVDCNWTNSVNIGGRIALVTSQNINILNNGYADNFSGTTQTANPQYAIDISGGCNNVKIEGTNFLGLTNVHPYNGIITSINSYNIISRLIGSVSTPLDLGSANASGVIFAGNGNNDNIKLQRLYVNKTRTGPFSFVNSDNNILIQDVKGDYADTTVIASLNTIAKNIKLSGATTGQISVYGTHWLDVFTSDTVGRIEILCNEPTVLSSSQCSITGGTPKFNSVGQVALTTIGDQITWEMPYFARGHMTLANIAPTLTGTNTGNMTYEFQCDKGSGYGGTWLTLNATNLNAQGSLTPSIGVKLKVRATCSVANAGNLLTNIRIPTTTSLVNQNINLYPLDENTITFTGLNIGTDIVILNAGTSTILDQQDSISGTQYSYIYSGAQTVDVGFIKAGYIPLYIRSLSLGTTNSTLPISMVLDRNYA